MPRSETSIGGMSYFNIEVLLQGMPKKDFAKLSLALHKKNHGKIGTLARISVKTRDDLSVAYTPGVGAVSSLLGKNPALAREYSIKKNTVAVISDGSAVLGLGNIGPEGALPVMEGKALLFKSLANVDAWPIVLATQDTEEIIKTIKHIAPGFGGINLEDISAPRCFEIESRLKRELDIPVMHDDQWGTATVVLAAIINALKLRTLNAAEARVVINGAGASATAVAYLMMEYGISNIVLCDTKGIVSRNRTDLGPDKRKLAEASNPEQKSGDLAYAMKDAHIFIGLSKAGVLNSALIKTMHPRPIVIAMANPVPEIMPDEAKKAGAFIVATGRSDFPNQVNNVLVFPGVFRGALDHAVSDITHSMLINAAKAIAKAAGKISTENILPSPLDKKVHMLVAKVIK